MNEEHFILNNKIDEVMDIQIYDDQTTDDQISVKYSKLLRKCEQIKMENFKLINYIDQINKLVRKVRKQNAFICTKLDQNNDDYHKVKPTILHEIELVINYGKNKLNKDNATKPKVLNKAANDKSYESTIDHRNKRIKIENEVDTLGTQTASHMASNLNSLTNLTSNLASNLIGNSSSLATSSNLAYQITSNLH